MRGRIRKLLRKIRLILDIFQAKFLALTSKAIFRLQIAGKKCLSKHVGMYSFQWTMVGEQK